MTHSADNSRPAHSSTLREISRGSTTPSASNSCPTLLGWLTQIAIAGVLEMAIEIWQNEPRSR
jgi:hypothetical protein